MQEVSAPHAVWCVFARLLPVGRMSRRQILACGFFLLVTSLTLTLILVSQLGRPDWDNYDVGKRSAVEFGREAPNRNILEDVQYSNAGREKVVDHFDTNINCTGPWPGYPECENRMNWMKTFWTTHPCYAKHGVDGSNCTFQIYLSEVEYWCPWLPHRVHVALSKQENKLKLPTVRYNLSGLLEKLSTNVKYDWIANRIKRLWPQWSKALHSLEKKRPFAHYTSNILVHIGALSDKSGFKFAENAGHGGPLGELVQWSDLIASLYTLGYNVDFSTEMNQLSSMLVVDYKGGCPSVSETRYSSIFIDIVGMKQFKKITRSRFHVYKCLLRVLDSFGTEPVFNYKKWKPQVDSAKRDYGQAWGNWELIPRQFMTMYPHTPDNSFLGFVVESNNSSISYRNKGRNTSLVYGKALYMWEKPNTKPYLSVIAKYFEVHATIGNTKHKAEVLNWSLVPEFVSNHGILNGVQLKEILQEARLFIGLGFPYEGPAPLEAIAQGCVFLNPKVTPPVNRFNSGFFTKKPTLREIGSQNPYMEMFVGKPYVYTINTSNLTEVEETLREILSKPRPPPYVPYEFTFEGMLERITAYLQNQHFCTRYEWPPPETLIVRISQPNQSCKDLCHSEGLVCEPEHFPYLNTKSALLWHGFNCESVTTEHSVHGPSISQGINFCSLQKDRLLLSCAGQKQNVKRLCPCREYRRGQVALCTSCSG